MKRRIWLLIALVTLSLLPLGAHGEADGDVQVIHIDAVVRSYGASGKTRWLTYRTESTRCRSPDWEFGSSRCAGAKLRASRS
ncbi:hypothetical protein DYH09_02320 [bacterium CPR1]|nr:hypothetical protein [bacterium CPR1]